MVDDAPVAEDDANSVTEDSATTTAGNVLGDSGASDGDVEDTEGADGATVTAVESVNTPDSEATDTDGTLTIDGEFGTLTLEADGSYTYQLDNSNLEVQGLSDGETLEEAFTYTLTDGDTDQDDATLTITIDGSDDGVTVDVPNDHDSTTPDGEIGDQVVFESGLADGSNPNAADTRVESSLTLTALDGLSDTNAVMLAYTDESGELGFRVLDKEDVEALGDTHQTLSTQYGELTLNGYSQADDGTITLDYSYELTNAPGVNVDDLLDSVAVTANDEDGSTDSGDLNIKIVDDAPTAEDDANSVTEGDDTASTVETSGNMIGGDTASAGDVADTEGADGATVTAVESVNTPDNDATDTDGTLVIEGEYGTLTIEADGSYTYALDNTNLEVQGLGDDDTLTEAFTYTLTDGDTDADDATLTITIDGSDDGVTVNVPNDHDSTTPDGEIGDQVVFESGLTDGSNPNAADTRVESSFTLTALDGLQETGAVTLDYTDENGESATLSLSKAQVEALGSDSQTLTTQYGELTLNGYSQAADGTITLDYAYELTTAPDANVDELLDTVVVTATDRDGQSDSGDLNIQIVDDAPVAEDDTNSVTEGDDTASTVETSGNVLGGSGASDGDVADTEGADGATVTAVESTNVPGNSATDTDGTLVIEGEYGTLTLEADGSYTYQLDNSNLDVQGLSDGETLEEAFTYTLTDGDTDADDATLTISIDGSDDGVTVDVPNEHDSTTPDGEIGDQVVFESGLPNGSATNADDTRVESSFTLTALDGLQETGAVTLDYTDENGESATLTLSKAEVETLGDTPQSLTTQSGELTLNGYSQADDGTITLDYDYLLTKAPEEDVDNLMDSVTVTATDEDGSTDSGDLNIKIVDDAPTAEDDVNSVTEGDGTSGNVIGGDGVSDGDVADTEGADGATVTAAESVNVSGNSASGTDPLVIVGEYGTLTLNADGSYTYEADPDSTNADVQDVFTYTLQDGDGDESTATLTIDVTDVTGDPTDTSGSVDEAGLPDGTEPSAESEIISGASLDLQDGWTVEDQQDGSTSWGDWIVNTDGTFDYTLTDDAGHSGTPPTDSFEYTAVDEHGNTVTNTVTITIVDDQPVISVDNGQLGSVEVDETDLDAGPVSENDPDFISGVFDIDHGADGEASTTYSLQVSDGVASGVTDTATGEAVHLFMDGDDVVGRVGNDADGDIAFRIELDGDTGAVTLTQTRPLEHPDSADHDDAISLSNGALQLVATAVDGDNDSVDSDAVNVGGQFTFRDDGPAIDGTPAAASIEEAALPNGSEPDTEATSVTAGLPVDFGEDGAGELAFSDDQTALEDYLSENGNGDVDIAVNGDMLTATRGGEPVFTVTLDTQSGNYTFELQGALVHPEEDQDLALNFAYQVIDGDGDTVDGNFDVNVVDDAPTDIAITTPEDTPADPFTTSADATLDNVTIKDSDGNEVTGTDNGDGTRSFDVGFGTATVDDQGRVTFDPAPDYSNDGSLDVFSVVVDEDTGTPTETQVTVNVTPVADAPDLAGGSVETPEDTPVDLDLTAPSPVDTTDQNGATTGDNPELLGPITLGGIPEGTELLDGSGNVLWTSDGSNGGSLTIALTDGSHIASAESDADLTMTTAEYEALQINPIAQSHENFTIDLSVTSYEVDAADHPLGGVPGAESTSQVDVGVQAVTDDVDLTIDGSDDPYTATIDEDSSLDLGNLLGASFEDLDGSEERSLEIGGVPEGTSITVNGNTITAGGDGTIVIPASDLGDFGAGTSTEIPASLALTPPADFSGDLDGITVTLKARDHDSDAGDDDGAVKDDSVTLNIDTAPVADQPADISAEGPEDTDIAFLADLAVSDTDGSESITAIGIDTVPDGWVIKDGDGNVVHTGNGTDGFTIPEGDVTDGSYTGYTITPPAHSSVDESLSLQVEVTDTSPYGPDTQTHDVTADVTVTPDAEEVGGDSDGDGQPDLTMNPDHTYGTDVDGTEDAWFALNADGFNPADGWANQDDDGSEETFALLTPELVSGQGDSAEGSSFRYSTDGGTTWVEETFNGSPIEVPVEYLDSLEFRAAPNQKGEFQIRVEAKTVDTDPDDGTENTATSGESILDGIFIDQPVADLASLNVTSPAEGSEDEAIPLDIRPQSGDPNESFRVTISDVPDGAVLTYDGTELTPDGSGNYVIDDFDRDAPLTVTPPQDSNEDFTLTASVVTVDEYGGVTDTLDSPVTKPIEVPVNGVADEPDVTIDTPVYAEEDLDADSTSVTLSDIITAESGETGDDGSETLTYRITGLDAQFDVEGATLIRGEGVSREWVATDPSGVTITTPENFSGQVDFSVTPIVTENDGDTREAAEQDVSFQVTPSPEAEFSIQSNLAEDQLGQLNLSLEPQNGDTNESLSSVWIDVASVTGNQFELYYGSDGSTTLAEAAANGAPGVVEEGGYYKLTDDAWNNIYAQGDDHVSGNAGTLEVQYEITDTPNAGYEGDVDDTTVVKNETHEVVIDAVTDVPTVTITGIENADGSDADIDEPAKDVTADGNDSVAVTVDITQPDTDGSESLKYLLIDNVPAGVSVEGGEFVGQVAGGTGSQWRIDIDPDDVFDTDTLTQTVEFTLGDGAQVDAIENHEITITGVTQDEAPGEEETGSDSWTLTGEGDFGDGEDPNEIIDWSDANATMTEDEPLALSELVNASIVDDGTDSGRSAVTISNLPAGAVVNGMQQTTIDGEIVWYASTDDGSDTVLQNLLDDITVTPPANWNDTDGEFSFDTTLTTQSPSGEENSETISVTPPVDPVTDTPTVEVSGGDAADGEDVDFTIDVSSPADDPDVSLVDGQLVVSLDETGMTGGDGEPGTLWYNGEEITPDGDGNYVIEGVAVGDSVDVTYRPGANTWGSVSLTAEAATQENGATNEETSTGSSSSEIAPPPPEVIAGDATGTEDEEVELQDLGVTLPDTDSQSLDALLIDNVPDGWLVKTGSDAGSATLAENVGGGSWSILENGEVPAYVALQPPRNWSGTLDGDDALTLTARTTQDGESTNTSTDFEVDVQAVADGITMSPELSFGEEGDKIPLNLSAGMSDMDGSETATIALTGLGEHAGFFTGGGDTLLDSLPDASVSYDSGSDTYTLSGIGPDQINELYLVQGATDGDQNVTYEAWTTDGSDTSDTVSGDFNVNIEAVEPTSGDDTLLYTGEPLDGLDGVDVVEMRFGEDPNPDDLDNVETLDFMPEGQDHSVALEAQDVLDMTDGDNELSILGDSGDSVSLTSGEWSGPTTESADGVDYQVYQAQNSDATLKVQDGVQVEI
ncbi:VCBS domain-containing protein [Halomonas elongata]|uniref:VCBS domain-containing protein n=1 Tax=Halomonas elongata TaxID=2746 RepID=UPI0031B63497